MFIFVDNFNSRPVHRPGGGVTVVRHVYLAAGHDNLGLGCTVDDPVLLAGFAGEVDQVLEVVRRLALKIDIVRYTQDQSNNRD